MPRITSTLPQNIVDTLQNIANKKEQSFSKVVCDILELGLKVYEKQEDGQNKKENDPEERHTEYLLRILAVNADVLRCVLNDKSKYAGKDIEEILNIIAANAQAIVNNYKTKN